jgi:cysteinyl-tRNA synthetase
MHTTKFVKTEDLLVIYRLLNKQDLIRSALEDNFDTPTVISELLGLISKTHSYLHKKEENIPEELLVSIVSYVEKLLHIFGIKLNEKTNLTSIETQSTKFINILTTFRSIIKNGLLHSLKSNAPKEDLNFLMKECDNIRDQLLPELGIRVQVSLQISYLFLIFVRIIKMEQVAGILLIKKKSKN